MNTIRWILLGLGLTLFAAGCSTQRGLETSLASFVQPQTMFGVVGPTHAQTLASRFSLPEKTRINCKIPAEIQGAVFTDENGNGKRDQEESGVVNIRFVLAGMGFSQLSDQQGEFAFKEIAPGQQAVSIDEVTIPTGYHLTTAATIPILLSEGDRGFAEFGIQAEPAEYPGKGLTPLPGDEP